MKKLYFLFFFLLLVISKISFAQFIINSSHNPAVGDSTITRNTDTNGIYQGESGANRTWNFQNLTFIGSPDIEYYVSPSSTAYYSQFPNSNIASIHEFSKSLYAMPHYLHISDTAQLHLGYVFPYYPITVCKYIRLFIIWHYPMSYGSQYSSDYNSTSTTGNTVEYVWGTRTEICDAYGTIILPSGTYTNAIRIKAVDDEMDTVKVNGVVTNIYHNHSETYFWFVQGFKFSVFVISYQMYYNAYNKNVIYYVLNEPLGVNQISSTVPDKYLLYQNYPNPFNPTTNIKYQIPRHGGSSTNNSFVILKIFDILGKEVATLVNEKQSPGTFEVSWNAPSFPNGVYFYRLEANGYSETKKMLIIK